MEQQTLTAYKQLILDCVDKTKSFTVVDDGHLAKTKYDKYTMGFPIMGRRWPLNIQTSVRLNASHVYVSSPLCFALHFNSVLMAHFEFISF